MTSNIFVSKKLNCMAENSAPVTCHHVRDTGDDYGYAAKT